MPDSPNGPPEIICFPDHDDPKKLPSAIQFQVFQGFVGDAEQAAKRNVCERLPRHAQGNAAKHDAQMGQVQSIARAIIEESNLGNPGRSVRTFGQLRSLVASIRATIEQASTKMARPVKLHVYQALREQCDVVHGMIAGELGANRNPNENDAPDAEAKEKLRQLHGLLDQAMTSMKRVSLGQLHNEEGKPIVSSNETVKEADRIRFETFCEIVEAGASEVVSEGDDSTIQKHMGTLFESDATGDMHRDWMRKTLPDDISLERIECATETAGELEEDARIDSTAILMPKKWQTMCERAANGGDESAEPLWEMTGEELSVIEHFYSEGQQTPLISLAGNDAELSRLAKTVNNRCNGGLPLVRSNIEILAWVNDFEAQHQIGVEEEDTSPAAIDQTDASPTTIDLAKAVENPTEHSLERPAVAALCDHALQTTRDIAKPTVTKGDQITRLLTQQLYEHLEHRRKTLWDSPEETTAYDEFAIQFLLALTERTGKKVAKSADGQSANYSTDFPDHVAVADLILSDISDHLPSGAKETTIEPADAEILLAMTEKVPTNLVAALPNISTEVPQKIKGNKYLSQALLIRIAPSIDALRTSLQDNRLPAGMTAENARINLALAQTFFTTYILTDDGTLKSQTPKPEYEKSVVRLIDDHLRFTLEESGQRTLPTHSSQGAGTIDTTAELAQCRQEQEQVQQEIASAQEGVASILEAPLRELIGFRNQLRTLYKANQQDENLDQLLTRIEDAVKTFDGMLSDDSISDDKTSSSISLLSLATEADRMLEAAQTAICQVSKNQAAVEAAEKKLNTLMQQSRVLALIDSTQQTLRKQMDELAEYRAQEVA